uniref:NADH-ubiquinone oxidoreductase chain 5 n=1 Tax=Coleoptera sp. 1 AH-2016 TaxID=1903823 RepID=A0A343C2E6_9COLE|nr:NADH dehydrogenase subunit 5 [Coleoptera sp. 1 AH-2016]
MIEFICKSGFLFFTCISIIFYFLGLYDMLSGVEIYIELNILSINSASLLFGVFFDWMTFFFMSFVIFISAMIIKYSEEYMSEEKNLKRFIYLLILFVVSMMFVIMSSNLVTILLGWDGLGLVSYVLVVYYQNVKSFNAGMLTALSNRIGDAAILMVIAFLVREGSWGYLNNLELICQDESYFFIKILIILAAMTKSAQIPYSAWLPVAMAAPTPVSSLVHSSTLVTAGVYLLIRFSSVFSFFELEGFSYLFLLTMLMAGLGANFEYDLKKIIALSTLSQLGMMMVIFCFGELNLVFFHLLMHALFKALLFMCAGALIHNLGGFQDIRFMGSLSVIFPVICICMTISNMALCGLPFLSGFYSKDLIVEILSMSVVGVSFYVIFFVSVGLTVSYSIRLNYYLFMGGYNFVSLHQFSSINNRIMLKGMLILVFLVIFMGSGLSWLMFSTPYIIVLPFYMKIMTLVMIMFGIFLGYEVSQSNFVYKLKSLLFYNFSMFFSNMWNLPVVSIFNLNLKILNLSKFNLKIVDYGWFEYYGAKGLFSSMSNLVMNLQYILNNYFKIWMFLILVFYIFISLVLLM